MSHFYGVVSGSAKSNATRRGTKNTGLETAAASYRGAVRVRLWYDEKSDQDMAEITLSRWPDPNGNFQGPKPSITVYEGPITSDREPIWQALRRAHKQHVTAELEERQVAPA